MTPEEVLNHPLKQKYFKETFDHRDLPEFNNELNSELEKCKKKMLTFVMEDFLSGYKNFDLNDSLEAYKQSFEADILDLNEKAAELKKLLHKDSTTPTGYRINDEVLYQESLIYYIFLKSIKDHIKEILDSFIWDVQTRKMLEIHNRKKPAA